jgi:O-antigen/teichoic acid export membrane protein
VSAVADAATADAPLDADASRGLERQVGVGAAWKLVGQLGVQGIRLLTVAILARLLTPGEYGAAAIAVALATFAPTLADMGMGAADRRVRPCSPET